MNQQINQQTDQPNNEKTKRLNGAESFFRSQHLTIECKESLEDITFTRLQQHN
jgi:hypothetical protein